MLSLKFNRADALSGFKVNGSYQLLSIDGLKAQTIAVSLRINFLVSKIHHRSANGMIGFTAETQRRKVF